MGQGGRLSRERSLAVQVREFRLDLVLEVAEELPRGLDAYCHGTFFIPGIAGIPGISRRDAYGLSNRSFVMGIVCLAVVSSVAGLARIMQ